MKVKSLEPWLEHWLAKEEERIAHRSSNNASFYTHTAHIRNLRKASTNKAVLRMLRDLAASKASFI